MLNSVQGGAEGEEIFAALLTVAVAKVWRLVHGDRNLFSMQRQLHGEKGRAMVTGYGPQSNHDMGEPPFSRNGTHAHTATMDGDEHQYSDAYQAFKTGLDAWEKWQKLDTPGKLEVILTHYSAAQWLEPEELSILAHFRHQPPGKWAQIKLKYKEIGGNPYDLQCVVDQLGKEQPESAAPQGSFQPITASELYAKELPPLGYVVEDILPIGATLFVGRAKDGKSLAMWNLCMAVAEGGLALGRYLAKPGDVLYLALEDGERRAKKRLTDQMQAMGMTTPPFRLSLLLWEAPRLGEGLEQALTQQTASKSSLPQCGNKLTVFPHFISS